MSRGKIRKTRESTPMPATMAGLLRFYDEEAYGIKLRPEVVVVVAIVFTVIIALAPVLFK
ncbi:MAG: preprotein translocase subunit Sec61beta [Candidatus Bathyarchaeia archaeon]